MSKRQRRQNGQGPKRDPEDQRVAESGLSRRREEPNRAPETLKFIAEPSDDVEPPVEGLEWPSSKSTSTSRFTPEDTESREWVIEYNALLAKLAHPTEEGLSGHLRAVAADDPAEAKEPLRTVDELKIEAAVETGKEAATRAREGWATETATADTRESIVRNPDEDGQSSSRGGLISKLRR